VNATATFHLPDAVTLDFKAVLLALVILILSVVLGKLSKRMVLVKAKETELSWILNEDTAEIVFRMFLLGGIIGALYVLGVLKYEIWGTTVGNLAFSAGFFYLSYVFAKKSRDYLLSLGGSKAEVTVRAKLFYYSFLTIAFLLAINLAGISAKLSALLAAVGITGIVLGFAAQTVVSNFISGVFMYFDRPLQIGDAVKVGDVGGVVEDLRILSTRIRSWDGTLIRIPNEKLFNSNIVNLMRYPARRVEVSVGISYDSDVEKAIEIIKKTLDDIPFVLAEPEPTVYVDSLGDSAVILSVRAWAPSEKWFNVRTEVVKRIKEALEEEGIEIPFPQRVNWFAKELRVKLER